MYVRLTNGGRTTKFWQIKEFRKNWLVKYMYIDIFTAMNTPRRSPTEILRQITNIKRMEPGKLCFMRQGKEGPYYNHQYREGGRAFSRYVPRDQVETVRQNTEDYEKFQSLVEQYAAEIIAATRAERLGSKKKSHMTSSRRKTGNSKG